MVTAKPPLAEPAPFRLTLRQLPLPAKLVLTCFLLAVGLGYCSAMVQLHLKHSNKEGEPLPTPDDVVERFSGLKKPDPNAPPSPAKIDALISGDTKAAKVSKANMAPAFFAESTDYDPSDEAKREGERKAMLAFLRLKDEEKKEIAYKTDQFALPKELQGKPITAEMTDGKNTVKIRTLFDTRCQSCHKERSPDLSSYQALQDHIKPPSTVLIDGQYVRSNKQMSVESLTQSTHAHLLSFAVLFAITGLIFSFSCYPTVVRSVLGPIVLVAQVADISCWWLARVPTYGPYFALTIMATGAVVGIGLMLQILLGVFNLYGKNGKAVLALLFFLVLGAGGLFLGPVIGAALADEKAAAEKAKQSEKPPAKPTAKLEKLVMGQREGAPWSGKDNGSMAKAFFEKDKEKTDDAPGFVDVIKVRPKAEVEAEREGERSALVQWIRLDDAARKKAYDADSLQFKPPKLTAKYAAGEMVKVKSILKDRCERCHAKGNDQEEFPLDSYENLMKYVEGEKK